MSGDVVYITTTTQVATKGEVLLSLVGLKPGQYILKVICGGYTIQKHIYKK